MKMSRSEWLHNATVLDKIGRHDAAEYIRREVADKPKVGEIEVNLLSKSWSQRDTASVSEGK